ncbi:MAG: hypothetical protein J5J06_01580 [Phycisphaerae bacterium]|nr:hypothetical protein [Phycisphaerae bacterium]
MNVAESEAKPAFECCVRCRYSLKGLPARHACPECGLRFDEKCALYRATNARQVLILWCVILGGGWVSLRNLPAFFKSGRLSAWDAVGAIAAALWIVFVVVGVLFVFRRYRQGYKVAVMTDGLIVHLPGFSENLVPWKDVLSASIKDRPTAKRLGVKIELKDGKRLEIGGMVNLFPHLDVAKRFVEQVEARVSGHEIS